MIVIYHDIGGAHSTALAANIHVNNLPSNPVPDKNTILGLPTFDKITKNDWGRPIFIGKDEFGADVYTISRQRVPNIVLPAITGIYNILNNTKNNEGLYLVDTQSVINAWMAIGGFLSRRVGIVSIGRPIVTYGCLKAYQEIVNIVNDVKTKIKNDIGRQYSSPLSYTKL